MSSHQIPLNRPFLTSTEAAYILKATKTGHLSGDGPFTDRASTLLTQIMGAPAALLTTSCTHALEMSAMLLDIRPGDEVIVPSFTFTSTANAFCLRGATAVFVDCRPDTLNLDERLVEAAITEHTKAIVVMHYAGVGCDMEAFDSITKRHGIALIEDNAHGLGGTYRGKSLGTFGALATQSFHETKNVQCGEGGALIVNDLSLYARAEIIREKGTNRGQFFRGVVDKYRWMDIGSSYLPSEILAAFLTAQLESFHDIQSRRRTAWQAYHSRLVEWARRCGVKQPTVPADRTHAAHLYYVLMPTAGHRHGLLAHLAAHGIGGAFHYQPLHSAPAGLRCGRVAKGGCPVTDDIADRLIRLPLFAGITAAEIDRVIDAVQSYEMAAARPREPVLRGL